MATMGWGVYNMRSQPFLIHVIILDNIKYKCYYNNASLR